VGIFVAAALSTALGIWAYWTLLRQFGKVDRALLVIFGFALPLSPIVNLLVKRPILTYFRSVWGLEASPSLWPWWFAVIGLGVVGVSEESIKLLPLSWRPARARAVERSGVAMLAMAIGLGFGIGEAWFIAWRLYQTQPQIAHLPFYELTGFAGERVLAMALHSILVSLPVSGILLTRGRFTQRLMGAMGLHCVVDLGPMLFQTKILSTVPTAALLLLTVVPLLSRSFKYLDPLLRSGKKCSLEAGRVMYRRSDYEKCGSAPPPTRNR
jgi:uncharacterized membrane protein YhfC